MKNLNFENNDKKSTSVRGSGNISLLLGAGFSAPKGYPIGNDMNSNLLNFNEHSIDFSPAGILVESTNREKPQFQINDGLNCHQRYFLLCKRLIKEYSVQHENNFDYELFYDFIKSNEVKNKCYQALCKDLLSENEYDDYEQFLFNISHVYNQMVLYLLKDKNGNSFYNKESFKINSTDEYHAFLSILHKLCQNNIVNIHSLNHDLLFESFNKTSYINGDISDGFDEYGSDYYGKFCLDGVRYNCRLERYTGRYLTPIRLYKLHGSIDYVPFVKRTKHGKIIIDKYIKIKERICADSIIKGKRSKLGYEESPFEYHSDFLTGTTSKIQRYKEPSLFKKLFKKFKNNLRNADKLIIIGYGCKDQGINDIIKECYDYCSKPIIIIDKYANKGSMVEAFANELNAIIHKVSIEDIKDYML